MASKAVFDQIKRAIDGAPRNAYVAELHLQVIKFSDELSDTTGKEFCEGLRIGAYFGTEFTKMKKIASRLKDAELDVARI